MDIEYIQNNIGSAEIFVPKVLGLHKPTYKQAEYALYDTKNHQVNSLHYRPNKTINIPSPDNAIDKDGKDVMITTTEAVTRISLGFQKLITVIGTSFATGGGVELKAKVKEEEKPMFEKVQDIWNKEKLDFKNYDILETLYSQKEVAEIWYADKPKDAKKIEDIRLKCNVYKPSDGYELIPVFDSTRNMTAFGLSYVVLVDDKEIQRLDFYTDDKLIKYIKNDNGWATEKEIALLYGKIPVIYYPAKYSIWEDVQQIINRMEDLISNFGDTNDYNGSPILFAEGEIKGFSKKGETGKVIEGENDSKLSYVSNNAVPESVKLEIETLKDLMHTITLTPDLSFRTMVNLGNVSGIAMDRILTGAHLKAKKIQNGVYGEGIQRRLNFLVGAMASIDSALEAGKNVHISPEFNLFRIADTQEKITNLLLANGNLPIIDHFSSVVRGDLCDNPKESFALIQENTKKQNALVDKTNANNMPQNQ
jgi:SPP1 family phage portal protein